MLSRRVEMTATPPARASRGTNRSEVEGPAGSFLGHKLPMESPEIQRGGLRFGKILWPGRAHCRSLHFASLRSELVTFLIWPVVCGWKARKSICQQVSPGSFDCAP